MNTKILIIEDDLDILDTLTDLLEDANYNVIKAKNGEQALEQFQQQPDLILCDIKLPDIDGFSLLHSKQKQHNLVFVPFIFVSAKNQMQDVRKGILEGADDYIPKPFTNDEILKTINKHLKNKKDSIKVINELVKDQVSDLNRSLPHEFNTALTPIFGYAQMLQNNPDRFSEDEIQIFLTDILSSAKKIKRLSDNLIFFNWLKSRNAEQFHIDHDLNKVSSKPIINNAIDNIVNDFFNGIHSKNRFNIRLKADYVYCYKNHLKKCITELVHNALKFSKPESTIQISSFYEDDSFVFMIKNVPKEMPSTLKNKLNTINAPDSTYQYKAKGLGLGLLICKKVSELYNQSLELEISEEKFQVTLKFPNHAI